MRVEQKRRLDEIARSWKHIDERLGERRVGEVTDAVLLDYVNERVSDGAQPSTLKYEIWLVGRMFKLAASSRPPLVSSVPALPDIRVDNTRTTFFTDDEFERLLHELPDYLRPFSPATWGGGGTKFSV